MNTQVKNTNLIPGCDLGTTNSAIAIYSSAAKNNVEIITNNESGKNTTPSLVYFAPDGQIIVGESARLFARSEPSNVIFEVKRLMGRKFSDPNIQSFIKNCPYKIVSGPNDDAYVSVRGKEYSPSQISAFILQEMKRVAQDFLSGDKINRIVITVPAHFNDAQRQATKLAGTIAGLTVERIINEPTAAALAYGIDKTKQNGTVAVFDLGGGTFDISILSIEDGIFEVKATNGDTFLGGSDFDQKITEWLMNESKAKLGVDLSKDKTVLQIFKEESIKAKHQLSSKIGKYDFNFPALTFDSNNNPLNFSITLTKDIFEDIVQPLLKRLIAPCENCLKDSGLKSVDRIILVGGMTRVPAVQKLAEKIFKLTPDKSTNPDETVALGAAIQGSILSGGTKDILLLDVIPLSVGIETVGGIHTHLIKKNTSIPYSNTKVFSTAEDNQTTVSIRVIEGESERADSPANNTLDMFTLNDIRPAPKGVPQIEVSFNIDANGILSVSAKDRSTGNEQKVTVNRRTKDEERVKTMIKEAQEREEEDKEFKANAELLIEANTYAYSLNKELDNFRKNKLEEEPSFKELNTIHEELKKVIDTKDYPSLKKQLKEDNVVDTILKLSNELRAKIPTPTKEESENKEEKVVDDKQSEPTSEGESEANNN